MIARRPNGPSARRPNGLLFGPNSDRDRQILFLRFQARVDHVRVDLCLGFSV
jgi:hypothetical protein